MLADRLKCRCESCSDDPLPSYTMAFRHECEVRYVIAMASDKIRAAYLHGVAKVRGKEAAQRLRIDSWDGMKK